MNNEVTVQELKKLPEKSYMLIDIRIEYAFSHGHIDGTVNIPQKVLIKIIQNCQKTKSSLSAVKAES